MLSCAVARTASLPDMPETLIAAAIQMNSQADKAHNNERAHALVREAAAQDAQLVVLPEKFNVMRNTKDYFENA